MKRNAIYGIVLFLFTFFSYTTGAFSPKNKEINRQNLQMNTSGDSVQLSGTLDRRKKRPNKADTIRNDSIGKRKNTNVGNDPLLQFPPDDKPIPDAPFPPGEPIVEYMPGYTVKEKTCDYVVLEFQGTRLISTLSDSDVPNDSSQGNKRGNGNIGELLPNGKFNSPGHKIDFVEWYIQGAKCGSFKTNLFDVDTFYRSGTHYVRMYNTRNKKWKETCNTIRAEFSVPDADAGKNKEICVGEITRLKASGGISYAWDPNQALSNPDNAVTKAKPRQTTTYTVTVTGKNGCKASDQVTVNVRPNPDADAGEDTTICEGSYAHLQASGGVEYIWTPMVYLDDSSISNPKASPPDTTTFKVNVTNEYGCRASDKVTVSVNSTPDVYAGKDTSICKDSELQLHAIGATDYSWSPSVGLSDTTIADPMFDAQNTSDYIVTGFDGIGCQAIDTISLTVNSLPEPEAGDDAEICPGDSLILDASGGNEYFWEPHNSIDSAQVPNPLAFPTRETNYSVVVTDSNGCSARDSMSVFMSKHFIVNTSPLPASYNYTMVLGEYQDTLANSEKGKAIYCSSIDTTSSIFMFFDNENSSGNVLVSFKLDTNMTIHDVDLKKDTTYIPLNQNYFNLPADNEIRFSFTGKVNSSFYITGIRGVSKKADKDIHVHGFEAYPNVRLLVYNLQNPETPVRSIEGDLIWDGTNEQGEYAGEGIYLLQIHLNNAENSVYNAQIILK